uniref:Lipocalin/cytosolic fatty-acid binding domain-containing protein n=1 Tax=Oreochromis aureus TaxID=47969 RepID=A0A668TT58_OREAU
SSAAMASLLTLLEVVLCSLMVSSSEILPQTDFDLQTIAGKWHHIGLATNAERIINHKDNENGHVCDYPTTQWEFGFVIHHYNGTCRKMEKVTNKTDVPGKFRHISRSDQLLIVDVKYDEYTLTYSINTKGNETFFVNKIYRRSVDLSAEVQEKFKQFSLQTGVLPENIFILPKSDECQAADAA